MNRLEHLQERLRNGEIVILDGGTGTELQARGVAMNSHAWSAVANLEAPDLVQAVHSDYILAGAEVVITNTYAAARPPLAAAGLAGRVEEVNRAAVSAARGARNGTQVSSVVIAGSMSHVQMGSAPDHWPTAGPALVAVFREQAHLLAEAGVDVLTIEMITSLDWPLAAVAAALETGLPVWVGLACDSLLGRTRGSLRSQSGETLETVARQLLAAGVSAVFVMHTELSAVTDAVQRLADIAIPTPVGVYPNLGRFVSPYWLFDVQDSQTFLAHARQWVACGASLVGGCCGTRPEHIRQLRELGPQRDRHEPRL